MKTFFAEGKPIVCGGDLSGAGSNELTEKCFTFDGQNWNQAMSLQTPLGEAGHTSHPHWGFIMAGGETADDQNVHSDLVIKTRDGSAMEILPSLPEPLNFGCLVALDNNRLFIGGGRAQGVGTAHTSTHLAEKKVINQPIVNIFLRVMLAASESVRLTSMTENRWRGIPSSTCPVLIRVTFAVW